MIVCECKVHSPGLVPLKDSFHGYLAIVHRNVNLRFATFVLELLYFASHGLHLFIGHDDLGRV